MQFNRRLGKDGFTLVEVLVSFTVLTIIVLTFFQLFIHMNKTAIRNNEKIVATHLANTTMERLKKDPFSYIEHPDTAPLYVGKSRNQAFKYTYEVCTAKNMANCDKLYHPEINDQTYVVEIDVNQNQDEIDMKLINAVITVRIPDKKIESKVEGYVTYD